LYPVKNLHSRGGKYGFQNLTFYPSIEGLIKRLKPEVIIHLAEQPSAPYSMSSRETAMDTINNNLQGTLNIIYAVRDHSPDTHIIKLGTMGEYGCPNVPIPEGWFDCEYKGRKDRMLFPKNPHSMYHLSKVFDSDALAFACKTWGLRVTDLNQGFVYGSNGKSRYCYDGMFGTVLNRFIVQAVAGIPLTVYGKGGQKRGFIHINDSCQCLALAADNPPGPGEFRVANQITQWMSVNELAQSVAEISGCDIKSIENPRQEKEEHYYEVEHQVLLEMGLKPQFLNDFLIAEQLELVRYYKDNIKLDQVYPKVKWRK
jgi:UDP-sulfoquinovose synthase